MKNMIRSLGFSLEGFGHALRHERNVQMFLAGFIVVLLCGWWVRLLAWEWAAIVIVCCTFLSVELLNTAIERLSDVLDHERKLMGRHEFHMGMKWTKDIAASASLVSLIATVATVCIVFAPYVQLYFLRNY